MTATLALLLVLQTATTVLIFGIGLESTPGDALHLLRHPGQLLRALLAMYVAVPLVALAVVELLPLAPPVAGAILVLAASSGAPLLPRKMLGVGDAAHVFSLVVLTSLLAIVVVPAWMALLPAVFDRLPPIPPEKTAILIARSFFLPLVVGMVLRRFAPAFGRRVGPPLVAGAGFVLVVGALALLAVNYDTLLEVRWRGVAALAAFMIVALAIGHAFGGPDPDRRTGLAVACALRHIGVAVLVATSLPGPKTATILAVYVVTSTAVSVPYVAWRRHQAQRRP